MLQSSPVGFGPLFTMSGASWAVMWRGYWPLPQCPGLYCSRPGVALFGEATCPLVYRSWGGMPL